MTKNPKNPKNTKATGPTKSTHAAKVTRATKKASPPAKTVVKITTITDRNRWDNFIKSHPESNFLQSWDFYEFHASRGKTIVRRAAVDQKGRILAAYAGVVETAKRGTYLAIAGGPIMDFSDLKLVRQIFADIRQVGNQNHCVFVRVRPQLERSEGSLDLMRKLGLRPAPMYLSVEFAGIIDLQQSEDEILAHASQSFRRKLRKAAKENLDITADTQPASIQAFCELEQKHSARQHYVPFSSDFLTKQFEAFKKHDEILIYTARKDGEILAQNFMIFYGAEASYHYGVSSELGTRISAAPLLHLAAMAEARKRGCTRYNLWGIVEPHETDHRFYGVSQFKRSFGCQEFKYTPAHDLVLNPLKYQLDWVVETVRKKVRHV